ncbi:hypothetical protein EDB84DRAFT_1481986 [Lactarius hengduanensis]|nr:hypothetical protein EDB84DRAFT_1481986 [Lactarius hengduanensis]
MRRRFSPISVVLVVVLVLLGQASAAPTPVWLSTTKTIVPRQGNGNTPPQPFTTQTVRTTQTDAGPVTETCTLTFTPVTGANGQAVVQLVRSCTMTAGAPPPPPGSTTTNSSPPQSTSTPPPQTSTSSPSASTPSIASTPTSVQSSPTDTTTSTTTSSGSNSSSAPPPSFTPVFSNVPLPSVMSVSSPASSPTSSSTPEPVPSSSASPETAPDTTPTPSSAAQGAFQIPGKKISVLPIGLGIFAGISVIALIVVGLVTYERTKYRKIFRQRKLAEQGAGSGYGS